jgi:hypothetical protein
MGDMSEKKEGKMSPERGPKRLSLSSMDFKAGHWPGTKDAPWGLNEIFLMNHPEIYEAAKKLFATLKPDEEKPLMEAEMKMPDEKMETVDIKVGHWAYRPGIMYVNVYPRSEKWKVRED